jgi:hypothetical protein
VFCERTWNPQRIFTVTPPLSFIDPVFAHRTFHASLLFLSLYTQPQSLQIMSRARSNGRRLSALFDIPSSPLGPPTDGNSGTSPTGSPSSGRLPSDPVTPSNRRGSSSPYASPAALSSRLHRRTSSGAAEDLTQVGVLTAKKLKLKPESIMRLEDFAKVFALSFHLMAMADDVGRRQALALK